jgi:hypothetical protein
MISSRQYAAGYVTTSFSPAITAAIYARFSPQYLSKALDALNFGGPHKVH